MRPLALVLCLSALSAGSYWALTHAWAPSAATQDDRDDWLLAAPEARAGGGAPAPPPAPPPRPVVQTRVATETYAVEGRTADQVLASMASGALRTEEGAYFGLTTSELSLRYRRTPAAGGCVLTDVEVDLALTITLPEWTAASGAEPGLARAWGRFRRALAGHEGRHRRIAEAGADEIARALGGLRRETCAATEAEARRRLQRAEIEITAAQRRYDAETDHGRTEGAVWPQPAASAGR